MEFVEKIEEIIKKAESDPGFLADLKADPAAAVKKHLADLDIPEEKIGEIITAVKAKVAAGSGKDEAAELENLAKGALDSLKKLF